MEEEDEFGDLYSDVLLPFSQSSSDTPHPSQLPSYTPAGSLDLNTLNAGDDDDSRYRSPHSNSAFKNLPRPNQSPPDELDHPGTNDEGDSRRSLDERKEQRVGNQDALSGGSGVLGIGVVKSSNMGMEDVNMDQVFDSVVKDEAINFVFKTENAEPAPIIPGLSSGAISAVPLVGNSDHLDSGRNDDYGGGDDGERDDWDSDSEDDLQIVLNDHNHGRTASERGGVVGDDEGKDNLLVDVADGDPSQAMEEQEWGEDATQTEDGEKKEGCEAAKGNVGMAVAPKIGYSSHGYHPYHSQFKYIRPGATAIPGSGSAVPVGAPGQVRPIVSLNPIAGRGRGEWRPSGTKIAVPMQKGFHPGFAPVWGSGHGFGGGLEFTIPSHKTIFEVDIEGFEEKPWKRPDIDISVFFNFGLNEESWKDYCKRLEQLRLEATMQSKIRVYESARTEQEYDPDLPPELAAATGIHDVQGENAALGKTDINQNYLLKGSAFVRPPLPTGRAIQVEAGYGERLPSVDTRPPRARDSDSIIEIVCQDSTDDDSSTDKVVLDQPDSDPSRIDIRGGHAAKEYIVPLETDFDEFTQMNNGHKRRELTGRTPSKKTVHDNLPEGEVSVSPRRAPIQCHPVSREQSPVYPGASREERGVQLRARERSPYSNSTRNSQDKKILQSKKDGSVESIDDKHGPLLSPAKVGVVEESRVKQDEHVLADEISEKENEDISNAITANDTLEDGNLLHSKKKQKLSSHVEQPPMKELDGEDSKTARSSENSKARSGSSRDYEKWRDSVEDEGVQAGRSTRMRSISSHLDENEKCFQKKHERRRQEVERSHIIVKGREDSYSHNEWDSRMANHLHIKHEGFDRLKEREHPDYAWQRRVNDPDSKRIRTETGSRHRGKVRESERSDKDEHISSSKQLDKSSYRAHYDKDVVSRHVERDGSVKSRHDNVDDYHSKRRKDEEFLRRDHIDKEEILQGRRENTSRRKRESGDNYDHRKRDGQQKIRDSFDEHQLGRHKDGSWLERGERHREREEWNRPKQSHEENLTKRRTEEIRGTLRSCYAEDKTWIGPAKGKDENKGSHKEYQSKVTIHYDEQLKKRGHNEDVNTRGNKVVNDERRPRQEKSSSRHALAVNVSENPRGHEKKHKESTRKNKESEGGDHDAPKRNQEEQNGHINETGIKGTCGSGNVESEISTHHSSKKHKLDATSDDKQQGSRRGRSKLECWTNFKERDFSINSMIPSSMKLKEIGVNNNNESSEAIKLQDECEKTVDAIDNQQVLVEENDTGNLEIKKVDRKQVVDRHLDTVDKLKQRSERFKLPMRIERGVVNKVIENETLPSSKNEAPAESEIKQERPARKRRWVSNQN